MFLEDLDFTNETEFGYFFLFTTFCCNFKIVVIYVFFSSPWIGQVLSFPHIPSHWNPLCPLVKHWPGVSSSLGSGRWWSGQTHKQTDRHSLIPLPSAGDGISLTVTMCFFCFVCLKTDMHGMSGFHMGRYRTYTGHSEV